MPWARERTWPRWRAGFIVSAASAIASAGTPRWWATAAAARKFERKCGPGRGRATSTLRPPRRRSKRIPWTVPRQFSADPDHAAAMALADRALADPADEGIVGVEHGGSAGSQALQDLGLGRGDRL